jgi:hypothetical protein
MYTIFTLEFILELWITFKDIRAEVVEVGEVLVVQHYGVVLQKRGIIHVHWLPHDSYLSICSTGSTIIWKVNTHSQYVGVYRG